MIYKILIVKNRYPYTLKVQKYLNWFKQNTPIEIVSDEITTDFDVTTKHLSNWMWASKENVVCGDDIMEKLKTVVPENKYNCVVFIYGNKLDGIRVSTTSSIYPDTEFVQTFKGDDDGKTINHELFHAFFNKAHKLQIMIDDPMDTYIQDGDLKIEGAVDTNREMALQRLAPYWAQIVAFRSPLNAPESLVASLIRNNDNGVQTTGNLRINAFNCKTIELAWKGNQRNISCIPRGTYQCKYTFSWKFLKYTYEVLGVPNRSGIRIHSGNYFFDTQGCIILGDGYKDMNYDGQMDVTNSRITVNKFEQLLGRQPFTLKIV